MSQKVSLNRIIGNVCGNLGIENINEEIEDFARWSIQAIMKIGSRNSYKRNECEIEIKNFKAALPPGFVYPLGVKYKNNYLTTTKRTFRDFSKGRSNNIVPENQKTNGGQLITNIHGVPLIIRITFIGVFTVGEVINITVSSNDCGSTVINTFTYIVQIGDTPAIIASEFNNQFQAISNLPYTSNLNGDSIDLEGKSPDVNFNVTIGENSVMGNVSQVIIQNRVPSKKNVETTNNNVKNPRYTSDNLANRNVAKLNTGLTSTSINSGGYYGFGLGYDSFQNEQVFSIDNGCINFNTLDGEVLGIAYMSIDLDEEGWPLIFHLHEDAVTHYIQFMHLSRKYYNGKLPQHVFKNAEIRWKDLCGEARGDDEMPTPDELIYLANMWNQLIPLPNKNLF